MKLQALIVIGCIAFSTSVFSQDFKWKSKIDDVKKSGFHNILLSPSLNSKLNYEFSDIRIYDNENSEIPYLLRTEVAVVYKQLFKEYKIVSKKSVKGSTQVIIKNQLKSKVNNVNIVIKNSNVQKKVKLFGSDDQKNWFVIKDDYLFYSIYSDVETSEIQLMDFPLSDYAYFKIEVDDTKSAPINILKIGYYDDYSEMGKYVEVPKLTVSQIDSNQIKTSFIKISFDTEQYIDKVELAFGGPQYYLRNARIATLITDTLMDGEVEYSYETIQNININSNHSNTLFFSKFKTKEFYVIVDNLDNQPLKIKGGKAFQLNSYLTADLEVGKTYFLKFGKDNITFPEYDLKYFEENIPTDIPAIATGDVLNELTGEVEVEVTTKPSSDNKAVLWSVIGIVIVFFGFLTFKMVRDMKKKEEN